MAKAMVFVKEHGLENYAALENMIHEITARRNLLKQQIDGADTCMNELPQQRNIITTYRRTKDIYVAYHDSGLSPKFYSEHKQDIDAHMEAKKAYDAVHGKMPLLKEISAEFEQLGTQKQADREEYRTLQSELREVLNVKAEHR